ncbi:Uncharacterised protein [Mycobacteroides abscessus subsp. abscessus]|nr:Uncharacterised protein [Mycobacteroides abscessus subsp. abscessus]
MSDSWAAAPSKSTPSNAFPATTTWSPLGPADTLAGLSTEYLGTTSSSSGTLFLGSAFGSGPNSKVTLS